MADLPCPTCGSPLTFLDQYQRYYCHRCLQYAPEGYGDRGAQKCPTCGGILSYVRQYGRMYCYHCQSYAPDASEGSSASPAPVTSPSVDQTSSSGSSTTASALTTLVAQTAPTVTLIVPQPQTDSHAPADVEETKPEAPETTASPSPSPAPDATPPTPTTAATSPSREMQALAAQKPAAVRVKLFALKRSELADLCTVYKVDSSGTKDQLQDRLLSHLHDLETAGPDQEPARGGVPADEPHAPPAGVAEQIGAPAGSAPETTGAAAATALVEPAPSETAPPAAAEPMVVSPTPVTPEAPRLVPKVEHPCPTCGRELTYIAQYNRYYCYSCQRYAPAGARAKNACPTCGSTMRWIEQHGRWWCDSCQKYASADLPAPGASTSIAAPATVAHPATRTIVVHRHGSPAAGAGLVGLGLALYIVYAFLGFLGDMMGFVRPTAISAQTLDALQFFAFLLVSVGAIVGLYALRHRD